MTPEKFKTIITNTVGTKTPHLSSFGEADLKNLARDYSRGKIEIDDALEKLQNIYRENKQITSEDFKTIRESLERA